MISLPLGKLAPVPEGADMPPPPNVLSMASAVTGKFAEPVDP